MRMNTSFVHDTEVQKSRWATWIVTQVPRLHRQTDRDQAGQVELHARQVELQGHHSQSHSRPCLQPKLKVGPWEQILKCFLFLLLLSHCPVAAPSLTSIPYRS